MFKKVSMEMCVEKCGQQFAPYNNCIGNRQEKNCLVVSVSKALNFLK